MSLQPWSWVCSARTRPYPGSTTSVLPSHWAPNSSGGSQNSPPVSLPGKGSQAVWEKWPKLRVLAGQLPFDVLCSVTRWVPSGGTRLLSDGSSLRDSTALLVSGSPTSGITSDRPEYPLLNLLPNCLSDPTPLFSTPSFAKIAAKTPRWPSGPKFSLQLHSNIRILSLNTIFVTPIADPSLAPLFLPHPV